MSYYLSEAYEGLYNPRVDSYLDDNLRFIDFMQDHEIEEVVESVFWELRDYGNTLEESIETLELAASDEIICEAYEDILMEAARPSSRSAVMARRAQAQQGLQTQKARLQSDLRRDARRARVDGAISRVKSGIAGARGGMGRAAKALGGTISKAAQEGKARLGQLLRRGVSAVRSAVEPAAAKVKTGAARVGRAYTAAKRELSGEAERQSNLKRDLRANIRAARKTARVTRGSDTSAFAGPVVTQRVSGGFDPSKPSKPKGGRDLARQFGTTVKGKQIGSLSPQQQRPAVRGFRTRMGPTSSRVAPGTTGERGQRKVRGGAIYAGPTSRLREDYEQIIENLCLDLINAGYASDIEEAIFVIEQLNDETFEELIYEY